MGLYRYLWEAHEDDGSTRHRFTPEGIEQFPNPWKTRQFRMYSLIDPAAKPVHVYIPKGAHFHFSKRRMVGEDDGVTFVVGWSWPDENHGVYLFLSPDGHMELSHDCGHVSAFERNLLP